MAKVSAGEAGIIEVGIREVSTIDISVRQGGMINLGVREIGTREIGVRINIST